MIIDSHQHFWKLERGDYAWPTPDLDVLYRNFEPQDLEPILKANNVDATILVQANETKEETEYLLKLADSHSWILGVVGWVNLLSNTAVEQIEKFTQHQKFVGIRPMLQSLPADDWILQPELTPAINCLIDNNIKFDALVLPKHLPSLLIFAKKFPKLKIVIDHCAKPNIKDDEFDVWAKSITEISKLENVYCKLSGLVTEANSNWMPPQLQPYMSHIIQNFKPQKTMYGSDWPVINLASNYAEWLEITQQTCAFLPQKDQNLIFSGTAKDFYLS